MKTIYLIRHAKSSWDSPNLPDFDRTLNERGLKDAPNVGKFLKDKGIMPCAIISSSAKRARQTTNIIAEQIGFEQDIDFRDELYGTTSSVIIEAIKNTNNAVDTLFIVNHNPTLNDTAQILSNETIYNLPTCSVFGIKFDIDNWNDIETGKGDKILYITPKEIK